MTIMTGNRYSKEMIEKRKEKTKMMSKKQKLMVNFAMMAAACGVDMNRIITGNIEDNRYSKGKESEETQDKKILDAKIKRVKKAMTRDGCSKEEIQAAIDIIKIEHNEQNNSNC